MYPKLLRLLCGCRATKPPVEWIQSVYPSGSWHAGSGSAALSTGDVVAVFEKSAAGKRLVDWLQLRPTNLENNSLMLDWCDGFADEVAHSCQLEFQIGGTCLCI